MMRAAVATEWDALNPPSWRCPACQDGLIEIAEADLRVEPLSDGYGDGEPDDPERHKRRFTGFGFCSNIVCRLTVAIGGYASVDVIDLPGDEGTAELVYYRPRYVAPTPLFVTRPKGLPAPLNSALAAAEHLFWLHAPSCANAIRGVIELFLDDQGVPRRGVNKKGIVRALDTHRRLGLLGELDEQRRRLVEDHLLPVKWFGNAGSHATSLLPNRRACLFAFEQVEYVFDALYSDRTEQLRLRAQAMTKMFKPNRGAVVATEEDAEPNGPT